MKMFLLSAQKNFYIILSSYVQDYVNKNSSLNFMSSFGFHSNLQNLDGFWKIYCRASFEIIFRQR